MRFLPRRSWIFALNRLTFQRKLAADTLVWLDAKYNVGGAGIPAMFLVPYYDMRNIQSITDTRALSMPDVKLMQAAFEVGRPINEILETEAVVRAQDAAVQYTVITNTDPSPDMILAFEAIWLAGEFTQAYQFMSALRKKR